MGADKIPIVCCACAKELQAKPAKDGGPKLPIGWKLLSDAIYCGKCVGERYCVRAVTLPLIGPADPKECDWPELRQLLRAAWAETHAVANFVTTELYVRDVRRNGHDKMPKMAPQYLYPDIRERFPGVPAQAVCSIDHAWQGKYRHDRYAVIWTGDAALATARYPQPYPVPSPNVRLSWDDKNKKVLCRCNIGGRMVTLKLRGDGEFRRQVADVRRIIGGEAKLGEIAIMRVRANSSHRNGVDMRDKDGKTSFAYRTLVKFVGTFPRPAHADRSGTLFVRTDSQQLLVALNAKDEKLWEYHGDQAQRWEIEHRKNLQHWADDDKAENRRQRRKQRRIKDRRQNSAIKFRNRMDTFCQQVSREVVGLASRRRLARIEYTERELWLNRFPYYKLRLLIQQKAHAEGIEFVLTGASGEAGEKPRELLADDVNGEMETC